MVQTDQTDEFGVSTQTSGSSGQPFGYTGEQRDGETGFVYLRARLYDPQIGRFVQRDPFAGMAGDPLSLHRYAYVQNNPVNYIDPSGLKAQILSGGEAGNWWLPQRCFSIGWFRICIGWNPAQEESRRGGEQRDPTPQECATAHKLLTDYKRLCQKLGIHLSPNRLRELDRKRQEGTITSDDLPGQLQRESPGILMGKTLDEINRLCAEARQRRRQWSPFDGIFE